MYDEIDQTSPGDKIRTAAPAFFVNALKKYIARNSIKITAPEFAIYCACTWEAQSHWLNPENLDWALKWIVSDLPFPRMPADTDWYKPWNEWATEQRYLESERKKNLRLEKPRTNATPEQIAKIESIMKTATKNLSVANEK